MMKYLLFLPWFCWGADIQAPLWKYWFHFSIFSVLLIVLLKNKAIPLVMDWASSISSRVNENKRAFATLNNEVTFWSGKIANFAAEENELIKSAHNAGRSRRAAILDNLANEIALKRQYLEGLLRDFEKERRQKLKAKFCRLLVEELEKEFKLWDEKKQLEFLENQLVKL